jgi:dihydroneopterin aldolase
MNKDIVSLEGMEFHAFHGFYDFEREQGNDFVIDVHVTTDFDKAAQSDDLSGTVNYETIYAIVKEEMQESNKLLERLAQRMITKMFEAFDLAECIEISIAKQNPPIEGAIKQSRIRMVRSRK